MNAKDHLATNHASTKRRAGQKRRVTSGMRVGGSVVDRKCAGGLVVRRRARENHIGHKACRFVGRFGHQQRFRQPGARARAHLRSSSAAPLAFGVYQPVTGAAHAMVPAETRMST